MTEDGAYAPIYVRIQRHVRQGITSGEFAPGSRLPSENELAALFQTTRATVAHALEKLAFERLVVRRVGSGTYVEENLQSPLAEERAAEAPVPDEGGPFYELLSFRPLPDEPVYRLERLQRGEGGEQSFEKVEIAGAVAERISTQQLQRATLQQILAGLGLSIAEQSGSIRVEVVSLRLSRLLKTGRQAAVLVRRYEISDGEGAFLARGEITYRPEQRLHYEIHG